MHACRIRDLNSLILGFGMYWYTVYTYLAGYRVLRVSSTKWGTEGLPLSYGGSIRCRPLQTELTGERGAYGSYAPRSPIFLVRTAHLRIEEDLPSQSLSPDGQQMLTAGSRLNGK